MKLRDGLVVFKRDRFLQFALILTIISWIFLDILLGVLTTDVSPILLTIIGVILHLYLVLFIIAITGWSERWSTKRILLTILCSLPLAYITLYLMLWGVGIVFLISEILLSTFFSHVMCKGIGTTLQKKLGIKRLSRWIAFFCYFIFSALSLFLFYYITTQVTLPSYLSMMGGVILFVLIVFVWILIIGLFLGIMKKKWLPSLPVYLLMVFLFFLYLVGRVILLNLGYLETNITLFSIPVSLLLLIYACAKTAVRFMTKYESPRVTPLIRGSLIFFMMVQIGVHMTVILSLSESSQVVNIDDFLAFFKLALFLGGIPIMGLYMLITQGFKRQQISYDLDLT